MESLNMDSNTNLDEVPIKREIMESTDDLDYYSKMEIKQEELVIKDEDCIEHTSYSSDCEYKAMQESGFSHPGQKPYRPDCEYTTSNKSDLVTYMRSDTRGKPYCCSAGKCKTAEKLNLATNTKLQTGEKPFSSECVCKTVQKSNLIAHIRSDTEEEPYSCFNCEYTTTHKQDLISHMKSHISDCEDNVMATNTGEKPSGCFPRKYKAVVKAVLNTHMKSHTEEKPYSSSDREFKTTQKSISIGHTRSHAGETPFSSVCGFKTAQKGKMEEEIAKPFNETPASTSVTTTYHLRRKNQVINDMETPEVKKANNNINNEIDGAIINFWKTVEVINDMETSEVKESDSKINNDPEGTTITFGETVEVINGMETPEVKKANNNISNETDAAIIKFWKTVEVTNNMETSEVKEADSNINNDPEGTTITFGETVEEPMNNVGHFKNRRSRTKKTTCPYCFQEVTHFPRHLTQHHREKGAVKKLLAVPLKDVKRKSLLNVLRKQGYYVFNSKLIRPVHKLKLIRPVQRSKAFANGTENIEGRENHLSESQIAMICAGTYSEFYNALRIKEEVFKIMRADEQSKVAMKDKLICCYAESFLRNHQRPQIRAIVSSKMRELGRLLILLKETAGVQRLIDVLKPEFFDKIVSATKTISGYGAESRTYIASSLALHMGTTLKEVCDIATKLHTISCTDPELSLENIKQLRQLIEKHWNSEVVNLPLKKNNKATEEDLSLQDSDSHSTTPVTATQKKNIKPKMKRVRWTKGQKRVVTEHFSNHIKNRTAPKKKEVEELIRKHKQLFENKNWVTIKAYVYNCYKAGNGMETSEEVKEADSNINNETDAAIIKFWKTVEVINDMEISEEVKAADSSINNETNGAAIQFEKTVEVINDMEISEEVKAADSSINNETNGAAIQFEKTVEAVNGVETSEVKEMDSNSNNKANGAIIKFGKTVEEPINNKNHFKNRRVSRKKTTCLYCLKEVAHFSRHLKRHHSEEGAIKELLAMPLKDPKRRHLYNVLRRRGNYASRSKFIRPVRRSKAFLNQGESIEEGRNMYAVCRDCKGFFNKNTLGRHRKRCLVRPKDRISKREYHLSESQMVMICDRRGYREFYNSLRIKEKVFKTMKVDERSRVAMEDILICSYAESSFQNHKGPQRRAMVSNKMRELGRLLILLKETAGVQRLIEVLKPEFYDVIVSATKSISGYDAESRTYLISSLALNMGTTLKQVCDIATKLIIEKSKFLPCVDPEHSLANIKQLKQLIKNHWNSEVSNLAFKENNKASEEAFDFDSTTSVTTTQKKNIEPIQRIRWTEDQKLVVTEYFSTHIKKRTAPEKNEIEELIRKHEQLFENKNWMTIKAYVCSCYKAVNGMETSEEVKEADSSINNETNGATTQFEKTVEAVNGVETSEVKETDSNSNNKANGATIKFGKTVEEPINNINHFKNRRYPRKKTTCLYCLKEVAHFSRHLKLHHSEEGAIKELLAMPLKDPKKIHLYNVLRRRGNYASRSKFIRPVRRSKASPNESESIEEGRNMYAVCRDCKGFFSKNTLGRHRKRCLARPKNSISYHEYHLSESQMVMVCDREGYSEFYNSLRIKEKVFKTMKVDERSRVAMEDILICSFAESFFQNHQLSQRKSMVSTKMRELGRLLILLKETAGVQSLIEVLKPEFYDVIVSATKSISGYDGESRTYATSSLALHMGTTLKQVCDIATKLIIEKNKFINCAEPEHSLANIKQLKRLIENRWNSEVSNLALKEDNKASEEDFRLQTSDFDSTTSVTTTQKRALEPIKRIRWTEDQKLVVTKHFSNHIKNRTAPKKIEVEELMRKHEQLFENKNWVTIKAYVYNCYKDLNDMETSEVKEAESNINETDGATIEFGKTVEEPVNNINHFKNRRSSSKKNTCLYCLREVTHFSRHLKRHHSEEGAIKELLAMPLKDPKRKHLYNVIRKKGNYASSSKFIRPVQRSKHNESESIEEGRNMYAACRDCKGFYKRNCLGRHRKTCPVRAKNRISKRDNHLSESQMTMTCVGAYSEFYNSLRIKKEVFKIMRADERSRVAMGDILICSYAESFLRNHQHPQIKATVSSKMRELGRLLIFLKETNGVQRLIDVLKPEFYDNIVSATKSISGYDPESQTYAASSLALHMGTTLKQVCDIATKLIIDKNKFISCADPERSVEDIEQLRQLIENHWNSEVCKENNRASKEDFNLQDSDSTTPVTTTQKKNIEPIKRVRWTEEQKLVVREHFSYHIKNEISPKKKEVQELMWKHEKLFENKNWVTIKAYVYNCYRQK